MPTGRDSGIRDARGRPAPGGTAGRVVSLVPSLTETVCALGAGDRLVGRTGWCVEPAAETAGIAAVGGPKNPDLRLIGELRPDLVLACIEENKPAHLRALEEAGIPVFAVMPRTLDDVDALLRDLGVILGTGAAAATARGELASARADAARRREALAEARGEAGLVYPVPAATLVWRDPWMAAGGGVYIDAMMAASGLANVLSGRDGYPGITLEELRTAGPEILLLPDEPRNFDRRDAEVLAAARVVVEPERCILLDGRDLAWYGIRTAGALRSVSRTLRRAWPTGPSAI